MYVRRHRAEVEVFAPAKVNLFLEVRGKRPDGYHEIETLMAPVSVYDSLIFRANNDGEIILRVRWAAGLRAAMTSQVASNTSARELHPGEVPGGPENLAWRAAMLLKQRADVSLGAEIDLVKRIPAAAGLGGASSDAAAVLVAANAAWNLGWSRERLAGLAQELGSDVPFFLTGGAAIGRGRGECLEEVSSTRLNMVIVKPPVGLSTPQVYQACQPAAQPRSVVKARDSLAAGRCASLEKELVNGLEAAAASLTPWIDRLRTAFSRQSVEGHQMSGSGSSYFGLCRSRRQARRIAVGLRAQGLGAAMTAATLGGSFETK